MHLAIREVAYRDPASKGRSPIVLEALRAAVRRRNGGKDEIEPHPVPIEDRIRRLPEALLLTAGYYASRAPAIGDLARRIRTIR